MAYKENVNPGLYGLLKQNGAPAPPCSPAGAPQGPPHHGDPLRCPPAAESRRPASPRASSRTRPCGAQHLGGPPVPAAAHSSDERCPPSPPLQKMLRVQPQRPRSQGRVCLHLWREHPRLRLHTPPKRVLKYDTPLRLLVLQLI
nr:vegetative cell wall protein gp1-like isoform X15 [Anas platyrhynchos]